VTTTYHLAPVRDRPCLCHSTPPRPSRHPVPPRRLPPRLPLSQLLGRTRPLLLPTDVGQYDAFQYVAAAGSRQVRYPRHTGASPSVPPWLATVPRTAVALPCYPCLSSPDCSSCFVVYCSPPLRRSLSQVWRVEGSGVAGSRDCEERALRTAVSFLGDEVRLATPAAVVGSAGRLFVVDAEAGLVRAVNLLEGYTFIHRHRVSLFSCLFSVAVSHLSLPSPSVHALCALLPCLSSAALSHMSLSHAAPSPPYVQVHTYRARGRPTL
jgi:hypothetical protein